MLPMVGLGGSAGGIPALQAFFRAMPPDSGLVFVVILHLSSEHESTLAQVLQTATAMSVVQVNTSEKVKPNCVYVIPPGKQLAAADGRLELAELPSERGRRVAVDLFFRTLADTHGPHSSAIVLSGADGDGAIGIKRVKERGGLTIVQDPDEAEHPGMPRAAIATGMVDWVLQVAAMPERLIKYHELAKRLKLPPEDGPQPAKPPPLHTSVAESEIALREILMFLQSRTGRDFSYYKRATILRRIGRRLQVNGVDDLPTYLAFLRTNPGEAGALMQDMLISVTNFFRDREAFDALALEIPALFQGKGPGDSMRVWVPACATGEEAYSIAMLLYEHARTLDTPPQIQIFATDLDEDVIKTARAGIYPAAITADVSEERMRRWFLKEVHGYRLRREVRELVLFALHDLIKDSPFSRLDLVSCRNLFIYLDTDAQARAFDIFHFALRPRGRLFLGMSETINSDKRAFHRRRQEVPHLRATASASRNASGAGRQQCARAIVGSDGKIRRTAHGPENQRRRDACRRRSLRGQLDRGIELWPTALQIDRALFAAVAGRQQGVRHRSSIGQRGTLSAVHRRRADAQPAAAGAPDAAPRPARRVVYRDAVKGARRCVQRTDRARR